MIDRQLLVSSVSALLAAAIAATPDAGNTRVVAVDDFKARVVDGDWAPAVQAAIAAANVGDTVGFGRDRQYGFKSVVLIDKPSITVDGRNALIDQSALEANTGSIGLFRVAADGAHFSHLRLQAATAPNPRGPVEFLIEATNSGTRMRVDDCSFGAMPFSTSAAQAGVGFRIGADGGAVTFSKFETGVGGVFTQGRATMIADNVFRRPGDMSIVFNGAGASGGTALRNDIHAEGLTISGSIGIEEGASDIHISHNRVFGGHGPGIWCLRVSVQVKSHGGQIDHNLVDGGSQVGTSPTALIAITDNCSHLTINDNQFTNSPLGHAENAAVVLPTNGIRFLRNGVYPGPMAAGYGLLLYPSGGTLTLNGNRYKTSARIASVSIIKNSHAFNLSLRNNYGLIFPPIN